MVAERQARLFPWVPAQERPNHSCRHFQRQAVAAEDSVQAERLAEPTRGRIVTLSSHLGRAHTTPHQGQSLVVASRRAAGLGSAALADRKSTRLNSSHRCISYAVFCLKKKKNT